ncbi:hypothetical protein KM043_011109 [Ampulex compressa]|nr:hypothetical protein KM043_011109 [Ampulex compressa]
MKFALSASVLKTSGPRPKDLGDLPRRRKGSTRVVRAGGWILRPSAESRDLATGSAKRKRPAKERICGRDVPSESVSWTVNEIRSRGITTPAAADSRGRIDSPIRHSAWVVHCCDTGIKTWLIYAQGRPLRGEFLADMLERP